VERGVHQRGVVESELFGAVSVVDVPVDDRDALGEAVRDGVTGHHHGVVEDAEAHRAVAKRVMPGWADEGEASAFERLERAADGE
jgi:hypothetical protein